MKQLKIKMAMLFIILLPGIVKSQTIEDLLKTIESNNKDITAAQKYLESRTYELKNIVLPDGPEFSYGYFPENSSNQGPKETFEISQSFQMPGFYIHQSALSKNLTEQEQLNYKQIRQSILFNSKNLIIEFIYLKKMSLLLESRITDAENLLQAFTKRYDTGDVNILEVNKSKLSLLHLQNQYKSMLSELNSVRQKLTYFNNGQELNLSIIDYPIIDEYDNETIVKQKQELDPEFLLAQKQADQTNRMLKVTKNLQLPKISLGYGGETVVDEKFRGFVVGISIPIWGSNSAIKKTKFESEFILLNSQNAQSAFLIEINTQIEKLKTLEENLNNFRNVLQSMNNIEILKKSFDLGEISSIEYFTEISYYYQVYDEYMNAEKDFHLTINGLFKYKL